MGTALPDHAAKQELATHILRAQISCSDLFFEKLRGSEGVKFAQDRLPGILRVRQMDDEREWFPVSNLYVHFDFDFDFDLFFILSNANESNLCHSS